MSHQATRRPMVLPAPTSLECPLASLGRNSGTIMDTLNGHHQPPYHHPLSSSPLDPQVYQMSRKSPDLSIEADDIVFAPNESAEAIKCVNVCNGNSVSLTDDLNDLGDLTKNEPTARQRQLLTEMYQQPCSSSHSSLEQTPLPVMHKAATFEMRGRYGYNGGSVIGTNSMPPRAPPTNKRNLAALEHLLQFSSNNGNRRHEINTYQLHNQNADNEDSSDAAGSGVRLKRHQGGRCSVPTVCSNGARNAAQYLLEKKMDTLHLGNALRGLPLSSEAAHLKNDFYYFEDRLHSYSNDNEQRLSEMHILPHRNSSPSETSGSDRYLLNRTSSPTVNNAFSSANRLQNFSSSNNNTSSSNLALDQRCHHTKVKSLSDGLSNLGRFSPSLDQGYATLVSPSPTTGHHGTNTIITHSGVHTHAASAATTPRMHAETSVIGTQPWHKKRPLRAGPFFDRLPDEAILKLFNWLDSCELCNVARVCRRFEQLAWQPVLWKIITLKGEHLNGDKTLKMIFRQLCGQSRNGSCPEVQRVMLSENCRLSDKGLQLLSRRCPELTHLQLQNCIAVSNQALMDLLSKCSNLQHLDVTGCSLINSISSNPNIEPNRRLLLQYLDLTDCMALDDVGLKIVVKNCPQLVYLYLRRCVQITDAGLKFVPSFCIALKELSVSDCISITDFGLYELAKLGAALRYLSVAKCDRVSDAGLKVIARRCYKLRYLNARSCEAVSDDSITVLARSCPRLRALDIGKCDVSDAGLRALAESCPNLKKLSLRNCDMITDRGVQYIAYYCRGLQQLNIQDCQISIEGYRAVKKYCKRCVIEHTNPGFC